MLLTAKDTRQTSHRITSSFVRNIRKGMLESNVPATKTETLVGVLHLIQGDRYEDAVGLASANGIDLERMHNDFREAMSDRQRTIAAALFCTKYGLGRGWLREQRYEAV